MHSSGRFNRLAKAAVEAFREACNTAELHVAALLDAATASSDLVDPDSAGAFVLDSAKRQATDAAKDTMHAARAVGLMNTMMIEGPALAAEREIADLAQSRARAITQRIRLRETQLLAQSEKSDSVTHAQNNDPAPYNHFVLRKALWCIKLAAPIALAAVTLAASVRPDDVVSNLSKWASRFGIQHVPSWVSDTSFDQLVRNCAIALIVIYILLRFGIRYWRKSRDRRHDHASLD
jgi:hypothetical protein